MISEAKVAAIPMSPFISMSEKTKYDSFLRFCFARTNEEIERLLSNAEYFKKLWSDFKPIPGIRLGKMKKSLPVSFAKLHAMTLLRVWASDKCVKPKIFFCRSKPGFFEGRLSINYRMTNMIRIRRGFFVYINKFGCIGLSSKAKIFLGLVSFSWGAREYSGNNP